VVRRLHPLRGGDDPHRARRRHLGGLGLRRLRGDDDPAARHQELGRPADGGRRRDADRAAALADHQRRPHRGSRRHQPVGELPAQARHPLPAAEPAHELDVLQSVPPVHGDLRPAPRGRADRRARRPEDLDDAGHDHDARRRLHGRLTAPDPGLPSVPAPPGLAHHGRHCLTGHRVPAVGRRHRPAGHRAHLPDARPGLPGPAGAGGPGARAGVRHEDHGLGGDPGARGDGVGSVLTARGRPVHRRRDRADRHPRRCRRAGRAGQRGRRQRGQAEPGRLPAGHHQARDPGPEPAPRPPHRRARPSWPYRRGGADGDRGGRARRVAAAAAPARRPRCHVPPRGSLRGPVHPGPVHPVRLLRLPAGAPRLAGPDASRGRTPGVPVVDRPGQPPPPPPPAPHAVRSRAASSPGRRVGRG
jgi:hypothetical protein